MSEKLEQLQKAITQSRAANEYVLNLAEAVVAEAMMDATSRDALMESNSALTVDNDHLRTENEIVTSERDVARAAVAMVRADVQGGLELGVEE